jgi:hypothetical protein
VKSSSSYFVVPDMPLFYYTTSSCEQFPLYCEPPTVLIGGGVGGLGGLITDPHPTQLNNSPPTQLKKTKTL